MGQYGGWVGSGSGRKSAHADIPGKKGSKGIPPQMPGKGEPATGGKKTLVIPGRMGNKGVDLPKEPGNTYPASKAKRDD